LNVQISDGFLEISPSNHGFFMEIFTERVKNFYRKMGNIFLGRISFGLFEVGPVLSGRSIESDEFVAGPTGGQLVAMERHGVFLLLKTNNEITTNKIEEA